MSRYTTPVAVPHWAAWSLPLTSTVSRPSPNAWNACTQGVAHILEHLAFNATEVRGMGGCSGWVQ